MAYLLSAIKYEVLIIPIGILLLVNILLTLRLQRYVKKDMPEAEGEATAPKAAQAGAVSGEVVAAITAAISAVLENEAKANGTDKPRFIVRQIKKVR